MTHPPLTGDEARTAIAQLREETGRAPSVLAVATRLGLANTTFRRRFPDLVDELTQRSRTSAATTAAATSYAELQQDNVRLRAELRVLGNQLELALAMVQRLAEDKQRLTTALEQAHAVRTLPRPGQT